MTNSNEKTQKNNTKIFLIGISGLPLIMIGLICIHGGWSSSNSITIILSALAAMSVGALAGFLFGIPKTRKDKQSKNDGHSSDDSPYSPNTSLEEISDWLTKIIIGVGLVELKNIGASLQDAAASIANSMTDVDVVKHTPFILAFIIFYLIAGFFLSYLSTSFFLREILSDTERRLKHQMKEIKTDISHIKDEIRRHSSLESVVAQADSWRREGERETSDPGESKKFLDKAFNGYMRAIAIDENNIPAHIGLGKYYAFFKKYKDAREELNSIKNKLNSIHWSDEDGSFSKTMGRIEYNTACYYFLDGKLNSNKDYVEKAFKLLQDSTTKEPLYKEYARLDKDWENMDDNENINFERIIGRGR